MIAKPRELRWRRRRSRCGFTLVESVGAIVITGGMLVASLNLLAGAVQARYARAKMGLAEHLAIDLLWEAVTSSYREPDVAVDQTVTNLDGGVVEIIPPISEQITVFGTEANEADGTRRNFDDIDDYNGWTSTPPQTKNGTTIPGFEGWTRSVNVIHANLSNPDNPDGSETGLVRIYAWVTDPNGREYHAVALRSSAGTFDQPPAIQSDYVSWIGMELQPAGAADPVLGGAGSMNLAE